MYFFDEISRHCFHLIRRKGGTKSEIQQLQQDTTAEQKQLKTAGYNSLCISVCMHGDALSIWRTRAVGTSTNLMHSYINL